MNEFLKTINWTELRAQKLALLNLLETTDAVLGLALYNEPMSGILHLIDGLQDYADENGIPNVFEEQSHE